MIHNQEHIINKVFVEVNTKSIKVAEEFKNSIENFLQEELLPQIEAYFNSLNLNTPEVIQQITKLNLEVNLSKNHSSVSFNSIKQEIKEQLMEKLDEKIQKPAIHDIEIESKSIATSKADTFFYFLENGTSAWWNTHTENEYKFTKQLLFEITETSSFETRFLRALKNPRQRQRLLCQFFNDELHILFLGIYHKPPGYKEVLAVITNFNFIAEEVKNSIWNFFIDSMYQKNIAMIVQKTEAVINAYSKLKTKENEVSELYKITQLINNKISAKKENSTQLSGDLITPKQSIGIREENTEHIKTVKNKAEESSEHKETEEIHYLSEKAEKTNVETIHNKELLSEKTTSINTENQQAAYKNTDSLGKEESNDNASKPIAESEENQVTENISNQEKEQFASETQVHEKTLSNAKNKQTKTDKETSEKALEKQPISINNLFKNPETVNEAKTYLINNAGLILIHPFLKQFFATCGFLNEENKIIKPTEAVHLLHYIATKKEQQFESNLLVEKFLCNIPIHQPIERRVLLSDELKEKSEELLKAVVQSWDVLKNSSTDLIRYEFIQRQGKLDLTKEHPTIIVERKTQDILLSKLPWSVSLCKLPWMHTLIFTEW